MKKSFVLFAALAASAFCNHASAQAGSVELKNSVGTVLSTHSTIASAYAAIPASITQGYIIEMTSTYTGANETYPITFGVISGASNTNTIVLRPAVGVTGITIQGSHAAAGSGILVLNDADFIIIDGRPGGIGSTGVLTFNNTGTTANANTIVFINGACSNTVQYCNVNNSTTGSAGRGIFLATSASNTTGNSANYFYRNILTGGRYQVNSNGTAANSNTENVFEECELRNSTFAAFWGQTGTAKVTFNRNQFYCTAPTGSGLYFAIAFDSQKDSAIITNNQFYDIQDASTGALRYIHVRSVTSGVPNFTDIRNNFFSMMTANAALVNIGMIELEGTGIQSRVAHNTFRVGGVQTANGTSGNVVSACLILASTNALSGFEVRNNLMVNERTGGVSGVQHLAMQITNTSPSFTIDNNSYQTTSGNLVRITTNLYQSIPAYQAAVPGGAPGDNTVTVQFAGTNDLHLNCAEWNNNALLAPMVGGVAADIDGDLRGSNTFRGADEGVSFNVLAYPTCTASNGSVTFFAGAAGLSYTWMPAVGTGSVASGIPAGVYTVMVSDGANCNVTKVLNLTQAPPAFTTAITALDNAACFGTATGGATLTSGGDPGPFTYTWLPSGGFNASATGLSAGVYSVITSNSLACSRVTTLVISQPSAFTMSSSANSTICAGDEAVLTATAFGGVGTLTYSWTGGPASQDYSVQPVTNTIYSVTALDANNCAATGTTEVAVNPLPVITVNDGAICVGETFTMVPAGATFYLFSAGSDTVMPTSDASYTVIGTDLNGCSDFAVSDVTVHPLPNIAVSGGSICSGSAFTLSPTGGVSYTFSNGSNVVNPTANTSYTVEGVDANNCVNSAVAEVTVNALPIISVNNGSVCTGSTYTLIPTGALNYTFSSGSPAVTPAQTSTYLVTGEDGSGCINFATSTVSVLELPTVTLNIGNSTLCVGYSSTFVQGWPAGGSLSGQHLSGNSFTPAIAGTFTLSYSYTNATTGCTNTTSRQMLVEDCTGIDEHSAALVSVYPNPGTGMYVVSAGENEVTSVRVTDVAGRLVFATSAAANTVSIDISEVSSGIYYFQVAGKNGVRTVKVIKQ